MLPQLTLPTIQNWSCHNCSGCCRQHLIEITQDERQRILKQHWTAADGIAAEQPVIEPHAGPFWNRRYRLTHRDDGACVFLDDRGLCRIHAKFGEAAKPLACRIYPYAFHPAGKRITVSLRFSCPSVVANRGRAVASNREELKSIAKLVVPEGVERMPPPRISAREIVGWDDVLRIVTAFDELLADTQTPFIERLFRTNYVATLIEQAQFKLIQGERLDELLDLLIGVAGEEPLPEPVPPQTVAAVHFRLLVAHYARKDTVADLSGGWAHRWRLLRAAMTFAKGAGATASFQTDLAEVPFAQLEPPFGGLPDGADELLTRYLRVKVQGFHFFGRAYYDVPLVEGFHSLTLVVPAICWIARWLAASDKRDRVTLADFERAVAIADHHHGYSPVFGSTGFRWRVRFLARSRELDKLLLWYAR